MLNIERYKDEITDSYIINNSSFACGLRKLYSQEKGCDLHCHACIKRSLDWLCKEYKEPKPKTVWDLKDGDCCYIMTECGFTRLINFEEDAYFNERELGMLAVDEQELISFREWLQIRVELLKLGARESFKPDTENWAFYYDHIYRGFMFCSFTISQYMPVYFDTKQQAENAIQKIGEDRLKKYWFKVDE